MDLTKLANVFAKDLFGDSDNAKNCRAYLKKAPYYEKLKTRIIS